MSTMKQAKERMAALSTELQGLEQELVTLKARVANRKESIAHALRAENAELTRKIELLTEAAHCLSMDSLRPSDEASARQHLEHLREAVVAYCTQTKVDQEIWKKLAS